MRAISLLLDVLVVLLFAVVGRASHSEGLSVLGVLGVAWPFGAGMLGGWLVAAGLAQVPMSRVRAGVLVWLATVAGGMSIRALTGQGSAPAFVVVAALTLGLGVLGWRLVLRWVRQLGSDDRPTSRPSA